MKVNLPEPCHEDWNKMNSQEKGRFCGSCQKLVIDFSQMSDTEIINYFKEYKGQNTCGHFKKSQVDRKLIEKESIIQETPRRKLFLKELAAACFAFFLASTDAKAQNETTTNQQHQNLETENSNQNQGKEIAINGKVKNGNKVLSNAIISIKGTEHKTVSLENGLFSIYIPNELAQNQEFVTLVVEYEGLETKEIEVKTSPTNQFIEIDFEEKEFVFTAPNLEAESFRTLGFTVLIPDSITVKGKLSDETGETLVGVTVLVKGTNKGTVTDMEGNYTLTDVPQNATLVFSYISCKDKEIELETNQTTLNTTLDEDTHNLGLIVLVVEKKSKWYSPRGAWYKIKNLFR